MINFGGRKNNMGVDLCPGQDFNQSPVQVQGIGDN